MCFPNKTEELNIHVFNKITGINESKLLTTHANVNVKLMVENVIQIKGGMATNVDTSAKTVI